jgi:Flp pilus assembly protein TadG
MSGSNMLGKLKSFWSHSGGNVSIMFGLALLPMLGAAGAAVDYSRVSQARQSIAAASDAGALAGASRTGSTIERESAAREVFASNLQNAGFPFPVTVRYENLSDQGSNSGFRIEASTSVPTLFGRFVGQQEVSVGFQSQARSGVDQQTELVFVLDTTDSMEGDRIATLKTATNAMLDDLVGRTRRPDLLKVGVVPFAQYVNVGMSNRNAPWIDVPADYRAPDYPVWDVVSWTNCREVSYPSEPFVPSGQCIRDGRPRTCPGSPGRPARTENVCDPVYATTPRMVTGDWVRWYGCVGSRAYPLNTRDSDYGTRIPGLMNVTCGTPIQNLTNDIASVRSTINGLTTMGETYLPSGLIWGKRMLSPGEPLSATAAPGTRKIMVLVTDGKNTKSPNYPAHEGWDEGLANQLTNETCQNIANDTANPIRVFTVAFEMDALATKTILQNCATRSGGQFFDAMDPVRLRAAFSDIVNQVYGVRLTQ